MADTCSLPRHRQLRPFNIFTPSMMLSSSTFSGLTVPPLTPSTDPGVHPDRGFTILQNNPGVHPDRGFTILQNMS
jgi:hypothetical protein